MEDPEGFYQRARAQSSTMGNVLMMWAQVELVIEMHVKRLLSLTTSQACIVCGPLGAGAKVNLVSALIEDAHEDSSFVDAIKNFQSKAGRNALAHGFTTFFETDQPWVIVTREVRNRLAIRHKTVTQYYDDDFLPAFDLVMKASGFTDEEIHQYGLEVARLGLQGDLG